MSRITVTPPAPDDITSASATNTAFSAFAAATINDANLGSEAVDVRTLSSSSRPITPTAQKKSMATTAGVVATYENGHDYAAGAGGGYPDQYISHDTGTLIDWHASPKTFKKDDLIRLYWNILMWERRDYGFPVLYDDNFVWLACPQWDVTDNTLTHWDPLPGNTGNSSIHRTWTALMGSGLEIKNSTAYTICPMASDYSGTLVKQKRYSMNRGWRYQNTTAADITIYGIRLVLAGPFNLLHYDSGVGYEEDVAQGYGAAPGQEDWDVERCSLVALIHRGGA